MAKPPIRYAGIGNDPVAIAILITVGLATAVCGGVLSFARTQEFQVLSVTEDPGSRVLGGSVPFIMKLRDGRFRLYYCAKGAIRSAVSRDGLRFTQEAGIRIGPTPSNEFERIVCDPTVVRLSDGKVRMYYKGADTGQGGPGYAVHKIFSAVSLDGLKFKKEGLRINSETSGDQGWASVPDAIALPDGRVRIYYATGDFSAGGPMTMTSADGLKFKDRRAINLEGVVDPAIVLLPDRTFILLAAVIDERFSPSRRKGIYLFTSGDGFHFENETQLVEASGVFDPTGALLGADTLRVYYGYALPPGPPEIRSLTVKFSRTGRRP